MTEVPNWRHIY